MAATSFEQKTVWLFKLRGVLLPLSFLKMLFSFPLNDPKCRLPFFDYKNRDVTAGTFLRAACEHKKDLL
jgi:hypothetical protein